jgi:putative tryptophan/tyrosine transport system substrate-binding protein
MMKTILIGLFTIVAVDTVSLAHAQQPAKIPRIGFLGAASSPALVGRLDALRQGLRDLGYIEGKTLAIEYRYADGNPERLSHLAAELVDLKVDLVITSSTPSVLAIKNASAIMPIIFTTISHPVENGIIASFARPGGNITGLTNLTEDLGGKRLELLKEVAPKVSRIGVLSDLSNPTQAMEWKEIQAAALGLGLKLQSHGVRTGSDFDRAFQSAIRERAQALLNLSHPLILTHSKSVVEFAAKNKLPAMYTSREYTDVGGLMFYARDQAETYKRAAVFVDKILNGTKPGDIPVEQPRKFEFAVNLKAAKQIGLTIPPEVLARANRIIR